MSASQCDVAIVGSGPAGLQAAIHACGKKAKVFVFGRTEKSSLYKAHVANFCCYENVVLGKDLLEAGRQQAESLEAEFIEEDVIETSIENDRFSLTTESGKTIVSKSLNMGPNTLSISLSVWASFCGK